MARSSVSSLRSSLYRGARILGDVQAASRGPVPYVRRRVRAKAYAKTNGLLRRFLRGF